MHFLISRFTGFIDYTYSMWLIVDFVKCVNTWIVGSLEIYKVH